MEVLGLNPTPVSTRWKNQYFIQGVWRNIWLNSKLTSKEVYDQLILIEMSDDPHKTSAINGVIGNGSWTTHRCNCCSEPVDKPMIKLDVNGGEYDYLICKSCLTKALRKLKELK